MSGDSLREGRRRGRGEEGKYGNNEVGGGGGVTGKQPNLPEGSEDWEEMVVEMCIHSNNRGVLHCL